jgi:hypothetical protein
MTSGGSVKGPNDLNIGHPMVKKLFTIWVRRSVNKGEVGRRRRNGFYVGKTWHNDFSEAGKSHPMLLSPAWVRADTSFALRIAADWRIACSALSRSADDELALSG